MLNRLMIEDLSRGINMIDLGSSGGVDSYWLSLSRMVNLYAFGSSLEESITFEKIKASFRSIKFLPYATAGKSGSHIRAWLERKP